MKLKLRVDNSTAHQQQTLKVDWNQKWSEALQKGEWDGKDPFAVKNVPGGDSMVDSALYTGLLEDLERLIKVIPVKTQAQKDLEEA